MKATMKKIKKIQQGDLLYHPVHGLCRVADVTQDDASGKDETYYALVPKLRTHMKIRFVISSSDLATSGFHMLVSPKEANKIMDYFKAGELEKTPIEGRDPAVASYATVTETWALARELLASCCEKWESRDQRRRQRVERSAKGLVEELAYVFGESKEETAHKLKKNLGQGTKINPAVLAALEVAMKD